MMPTERRRGRVAALRRRRLVIFAATAATLLVLQLKGQLDDLGEPVAEWLSGLPGFITELVPNVVRSVLPIDGLETILLGAVVVIVLVYIASLVGSQLWNRWSDDDTEKEYRGTASGKPGGMQVGFYVWTLLQLVVLALFAIIGPAVILEFLGDQFANRDDIVKAWARAYVWTLVVGIVAFFWAAAPGRDPVRDGRTRVIGGVALALTLELGVAILTPEDTDPRVSVPTGIVIGIAAVALVWIVWPFLQWAIIRVARAIEDTTEQKAEADDPASILDYLGFHRAAAGGTRGGARLRSTVQYYCSLSDLLVFSDRRRRNGLYVRAAPRGEQPRDPGPDEGPARAHGPDSGGRGRVGGDRQDDDRRLAAGYANRRGRGDGRRRRRNRPGHGPWRRDRVRTWGPTRRPCGATLRHILSTVRRHSADRVDRALWSALNERP